MMTSTPDVECPYAEDSVNTREYGKIYKTGDEFIRHILVESRKASEQHHQAGLDKRKYRNYLGVPPIIIPTILAPLSQTFKNSEDTSYVIMIGLILSGMFSAADQYMNYGKKSTDHFTFEAKV